MLNEKEVFCELIKTDYILGSYESKFIRLLDQVRFENCEIVEGNIFTYITPKQQVLPYQGWKIHISAFFDNYNRVLNKVGDYCFDRGIAFKFINRKSLFYENISKNANRTTSGKFITIYPETETLFIEYMNDLNEILSDEHGPYILTDKSFKNNKVLYYRYGVINAEYNKGRSRLISQDGEKVVDIEGPYYKKPYFVEDPFDTFKDLESCEEDDDGIYLNKRYEVLRVIHFSNGGGVYIARDINTDSEVIIKEGRPYIGINEKSTVINFRKNEVRILKTLSGSKFTPDYVDSFYEWNNYFIVMEKIKGKTIQELYPEKSIILYNRKDHNRVNEAINYYKNTFPNIINGVSEFHKNNVIIRDLSASNIMISDYGKIRFIDLENSYYIDETENQDYDILSNLYSNKDINLLTPFQSDKQKLGYLLLSMICSSNNMLKLDRSGNTTIKVFHGVVQHYGIPKEISDAIIQLIYNPECDLDYVSSTIKSSNLTGSAAYNIKETNLNKICVNREIQKVEDYISKIKYYTIQNDKFNFNDAMTLFLLKTQFNNLSIAKGIYYESIKLNWYTDLFENVKESSGYNSLLNQDLLESGDTSLGIMYMILYEKDKNKVFKERIESIKYIIDQKSSLDYLIADSLLVKDYLEMIMFYIMYHSIFSDKDSLLNAEKIIDKIIVNLSEVNNQIHLSIGKKVFSPYLGNGTSGLLYVLLQFKKMGTNKKYDDLIISLLDSIDINFPKSINFFYGLAGIGYVFLEAYEYFKDIKFLEKAYEKFLVIKLHAIKEKNRYYYPNDDMSGVNVDFQKGMLGIYVYFKKLYKNIEMIGE